MRCKKVERLLSDYIDGVADSPTKGSVEAHLASCRNCASAMRRLRRAIMLVKNTPVNQPQKSYWEEFTPRLMDRLRREEAERESQRARFWEMFSMRRPVMVLTSGTAALIVAASIFFTREKPENKETADPPSELPAEKVPYFVVPGSIGQPSSLDAERLAGMPAQGNAPFRMVREMHPLVVESVEQSRGWLGIGVQELTPALQAEFGIADGMGVVVAMVVESGPARRAGIKEGDVIRSVGGKTVRSPQELIALVAQKAIGEKVSLSIVRDGRERNIEVTVGASAAGGEGRETGLGLVLAEVPPQQSGLGAPSRGLRVAGVQPGGIAARAGLRRGDIILDANRRPVNRLEDWELLVRDLKAGQKLLVRTQRGFFVIKAE